MNPASVGAARAPLRLDPRSPMATAGRNITARPAGAPPPAASTASATGDRRALARARLNLQAAAADAAAATMARWSSRSPPGPSASASAAASLGKTPRRRARNPTSSINGLARFSSRSAVLISARRRVSAAKPAAFSLYSASLDEIHCGCAQRALRRASASQDVARARDGFAALVDDSAAVWGGRTRSARAPPGRARRAARRRDRARGRLGGAADFALGPGKTGLCRNAA